LFVVNYRLITLVDPKPTACTNRRKDEQTTRHAISWHPADIQAAVGIARANGLHDNTPGQALRVPCHAAEQAIAAYLGVPAKDIWPARYDADGTPKHPRIRKAFNAAKAMNSSQNMAAE
jgi:Ner family transcriptional regulator